MLLMIAGSGVRAGLETTTATPYRDRGRGTHLARGQPARGTRHTAQSSMLALRIPAAPIPPGRQAHHASPASNPRTHSSQARGVRGLANLWPWTERDRANRGSLRPSCGCRDTRAPRGPSSFFRARSPFRRADVPIPTCRVPTNRRLPNYDARMQSAGRGTATCNRPHTDQCYQCQS